MDRIDKIINEEVNKLLITESALDDIKSLLKGFRDRSKEDIRKERKLRKKADKEKKGKKKIRKLAKGGSKYYDYDDYEEKHRKLSKGDTDSITDTVDQNNTDIAAVARSVFPDHTEEGAQSQLRKILNHERPMTKDVASKLEKMISRGKIAVK